MEPLPAYDWGIPPNPATPPPFAAERGIPASLWPLVKERFPEAAADAAAFASLVLPTLADITPPFEFPGVREAAALISATIDAGGETLVFGDFDADGVSATAILASTIRAFGGCARTFIPLRAEGYGLTDAAVTRCLEGGAPSLIVTVDCGITAGAALGRFAARGARIIVADHHIPDGSAFPPGTLVVAPHLPGVPRRLRYLCGAGVAFSLAAGLVLTRHPGRDAAGVAARRRLFARLDALAVATVADVVPLLGENRTFVALGLRAINKAPTMGIRQLLLATMDNASVTERHLGFVLGPHLNSAGRMSDASLALDLLLCEDADEARSLAVRLKQSNAMRKTECEWVDRAVAAQLKSGAAFDPGRDGAFTGCGDDWHPGVVGLAAAHACERIRRPVALVSFAGGDVGRGSVRAPGGYDVHAALAECSAHLLAFGGHESAAGLTVARSSLRAFAAAFSAACLRQVGAPSVVPSLDIAARLRLDEVTLPLLEAVSLLAPFGEANAEPVFEFDGVSVAATPLGRDGTKGLKLALGDAAGGAAEALWFGAADRLDAFRRGGCWDVAASLLPDDYGGRHGVKLKVVDARQAVGGGAAP